MSIALDKHHGRRGFTLLEILLAVAILAMMAVSIYRFVASNLTAVRVSSQENMIEARYTGFINLLTSQWQQLPVGDGALTGEPFKFSDQPQDEVTWRCGSGPGLLTRYAPGEYFVTMRLQRNEQKSDQTDVVFMRKPSDAPEGSTEGQSWVQVLEDVRSMKIRYFDPRLPAWVERWTDRAVMPRLIRLVIGRPDRTEPWEVIIALGRTPLALLPPNQQLQQGQQQPQPGQQQPPGTSTLGKGTDPQNTKGSDPKLTNPKGGK